MKFSAAIDFAALMEPVASNLLGKPNERLSKPPRDVRFDTNGSLSVDFEAGRFYDHENKLGGGVIDLIKHKRGTDHAGAVSWLRRERFLSDPPRSIPARYQASPNGKSPPSSADEKSPRKIEATYAYTDEHGQVLFQVVRFDPKDFRQRRPGPDARWIWNLEDVQRVLYRLPDVRAAVAAGIVIYVVEGEKDADALAALGIVATTNSGGAGKWDDGYAECLRGADVVIAPDNDKVGRDHAEAVAASLSGIAKRIRLLDLAEHWPDCPDKGDISDWIDSGGDANKLAELVAALPDYIKVERGAVNAWPVMDEAAYYGIAGDFVRTMQPHTEADPAGLLIQFLVAFGSVVGHLPYYLVEGDKHYTNLFAVLVGNSSRGRKGTGAGRVRSVSQTADATWSNERMLRGSQAAKGSSATFATK